MSSYESIFSPVDDTDIGGSEVFRKLIQRAKEPGFKGFSNVPYVTEEVTTPVVEKKQFVPCKIRGVCLESLFRMTEDALPVNRRISFESFREKVEERCENVPIDVDVDEEHEIIEEGLVQACIREADDLPTETYSIGQSTTIKSVLIGADKDIFYTKFGAVEVLKHEGFITTPNAIIAVPSEILYTEFDKIRYVLNAVHPAVVVDKNFRHFKNTDPRLLNEHLSRVSNLYPEYRKTCPDGYYHPYDSTGRLNVSVIENSSRMLSLVAFLREFFSRLKLSGRKGVVGLFSKTDYEKEYVRKFFVREKLEVEVITPYSTLVPDIVIEFPCSAFPHASFNSDMSYNDYEAELVRRKDTLFERCPHWQGVNSCIFGIGNYLIPPLSKVKHLHIVLPASLHRNKVFVYMGGFGKGQNGIQFRNYTTDEQDIFSKSVVRWVALITFVSAYRNFKLTKSDHSEAKLFWSSVMKATRFKKIDRVIELLIPNFLSSPVSVSGASNVVSFFKRSRVRNNSFFELFSRMIFGTWYSEAAFIASGYTHRDLERFVTQNKLKVWITLGSIYFGLVVPIVPETQLLGRSVVNIPKVCFGDVSTTYDIQDSLLVVPYDFSTVFSTLGLVDRRMISKGVVWSAGEYGYNEVEAEPVVFDDD